jgi:hypothetical protein
MTYDEATLPTALVGPVERRVRHQLRPCPMCGSDTGYLLSKADTHKWWRVACYSCDQLAGECRASVDWHYLSRDLPHSSAAADQIWDEAAAYAECLRRERDHFRGLLLWALWHHQGSSSPVGQPIRAALGIDKFAQMSADEIRAGSAAVAHALMPNVADKRRAEGTSA